MGMYTQIHFGTRIRPDISEEVKSILDYMVGNTDNEPIITDEHLLFKTGRWSSMLRSDSYYFDYRTANLFKFDEIGSCYWLNVTSNLKNYDNEIVKFLNWINQFIDESVYSREFLGYFRYEEDNEPTLIYKKDLVNYGT